MPNLNNLFIPCAEQQLHHYCRKIFIKVEEDQLLATLTSTLQAITEYVISMYNYMNLLSLIHTFLQMLIGDTPIFDYCWSGDHCSWMCVSWTCKVHHYTVIVSLINTSLVSRPLPDFIMPLWRKLASLLHSKQGSINTVSCKSCCIGKTLLTYYRFIHIHIAPLCAQYIHVPQIVERQGLETQSTLSFVFVLFYIVPIVNHPGYSTICAKISFFPPAPHGCFTASAKRLERNHAFILQAF